ncbi:ubiquitin-specific protease ubp15, partial [Linderina pennispora]
MDDDRVIFNRSPPPPYSEADPATQPPQYITGDHSISMIQNQSPQFTNPTIADDAEFIRTSVPMLAGRAISDTGAFHWNIDSWQALLKRNTSATFYVGGRRWKLLVYPHGNNAPGQVSLYLCHTPTSTAPPVHASFALAISNSKMPAVMSVNSTSHVFAPEDDWGFTRFISRKDLRVRLPGYSRPVLQNGRARISAYVRVYRSGESPEPEDQVVSEPTHLHTGHIGLVADPASLYLNSVVLSLYHIPQFRHAIARIADSGAARMAVGTAMQDLFHSLALQDSPPSAAALVAAIHDQSDETPATSTIQHYMRLLCECLARRMADTPDESLIDCLFMGTERTTTECLNVSYANSRSEPIYDLALNISNVSTLQQAIERYCAPETLDGSNKYRTSEFGYQDAVRFSRFESLPPVLHVYLNRFEYDLDTGELDKNQTWIQYPESLDMAEFMADDVDQSMSWQYMLHGVLLHHGDMLSGRYFCLMRSDISDGWLCYEDDLVYPVSPDFVLDTTNDISSELTDPRALDHQQAGRFDNAYALVYIRTCMLPQVCSSDQPLTLPIPRRTLRAASILSQGSIHLPTLTVYIIDNKQGVRYPGFDLCSHPNIPGASASLIELTFSLTTSSSDFILQACSALGRLPTEVRFWHMATRVNKTLRCDSPVDWQNISAVRDLMKIQGSAYSSVYLYCELRQLSDPVYFFKNPVPPNTTMVHLKFYDPVMPSLVVLGHIYVNAKLPIRTVVPILCARAQLPKKSRLWV